MLFYQRVGSCWDWACHSDCQTKESVKRLVMILHSDRVGRTVPASRCQFYFGLSRLLLLVQMALQGPFRQDASPSVREPVIDLVDCESGREKQRFFFVIVWVRVVLMLTQPFGHDRHRLQHTQIMLSIAVLKLEVINCWGSAKRNVIHPRMTVI